jgi:hypothetical protein
MIIDPDRQGCTIWFGDKVQHIDGTPEQCCDKIINFITRLYKDKYGVLCREQIYDIKLDITGIGRVYAEYFVRCDIEFQRVLGGKIIK